MSRFSLCRWQGFREQKYLDLEMNGSLHLLDMHPRKLTPSSCRDWPARASLLRSRGLQAPLMRVCEVWGGGVPKVVNQPMRLFTPFPLIPATPALTPPLGEFTGRS